MKPLFLAFVLSLGAGAALANAPTMVLPDLVFPPSQPDVSTQGCQPVQGATPCK